MTYDMMLDLETLGTSNRAALIQVGWAIFDLDGNGVMTSGQQNVDLGDAIKLGGEVDDGGFRFWMNQPDVARASVSAPAVKVGTACNVLRQVWAYWKCVNVWGHGASFDPPIMDFYFRAWGDTPPWRYSAIRDTRTMIDMAQRLGWDRRAAMEWTEGSTAHTGEMDARAQVLEVQRAWRYINILARPDLVTAEGISTQGA